LKNFFYQPKKSEFGLPVYHLSIALSPHITTTTVAQALLVSAFRARLRSTPIDANIARFIDAHVMGKRNRRSSDGQPHLLTPVQQKVVTRFVGFRFAAQRCV
jgi:hypothetical protein